VLGAVRNRDLRRLSLTETGDAMIPIRDLFEGHLTVSDLQRSMAFFGNALRTGTESILGLWEVGTAPQRLSLHLAFRADLPDLLEAPERLRAANITPRDFWGNPIEEPAVLAWMPAASLYFRDPDGNLLEFLCSLIPRSPNWESSVGVAGRTVMTSLSRKSSGSNPVPRTRASTLRTGNRLLAKPPKVARFPSHR
jgi:lactoylglutathione lyase